MPFGLGFFATAGVSASAGSFDLLETQVLTGNQASVEFTSLNATYGSTYKHLQIRMVTLSNLDDWFKLQVNGATTNFYSHKLLGESGSVTSSALVSTTTGMNDIGLAGSSSIPGRAIIDILDPFITNKNTVIRSFTGGPNSVALVSGLWNDTAAVTSLKLNHKSSTFAQYSRFSLYGIKGA